MTPARTMSAVLAILWLPALASAQAPTESAAARQALTRLLDDAWEFDMRENPLSATHAGDHRFGDKLSGAGEADFQRRAAAARDQLQRLVAIDRGELARADQVNCDLFERSLRDDLANDRFQTRYLAITNRSGFHVEFPELGRSVPLASVRDYDNYVSRLKAFGRFVDENIALMRTGVKKGLVLPAIVLEGYREPIVAHVVDDPAKSVFYEPFRKFPDAVPAAQRERLSAAGRQAIAESVVPAYRRFLTFMEKEYVPSSRATIAASALPNGREFYKHCVWRFTTLDLSPEEIHATGLSEVRRIRAEMQAVIQKSGFQGDMPQFLEFLRTDPRFYATTPEQLMKETAIVLKKMDGELPKLFKRLPRMPYGIREIPAYIAPRTTTAYYSPPSGDGRLAGFYYVNTFNLKSRPLYEIEALSLHEAVPGHHLQIAMQQELEGLPKFRRYASFTVFVEGWALYAERLGLETGFYQDPYRDFGRLTYEMWRACRLVVDTGMHWKGWSRKQAIDFMAANTALSLHNIEAEVDRYISWPGQALAYKIGELKIRQLRARAEKELGDRFDVREFHDAVLSSGSVPLVVLEDNVNRYIAAAKVEAAPGATPPPTSTVQPHAANANADDRDTAGINVKTNDAARTRRTKLAYPATAKINHVDDYRGTKVPDPYRWLEQPDAPETKKWVEAQNRVTFGYLETIPQRKWVRDRLTKLWDYEKFGIPSVRGGRYFYERNAGLQNQSVLYVAQTLDAEPRLLLDPNTLSKDGTVALSGTAISDDGKRLAYAISTAGSDWKEWKVRDVATGKDLSDRVQWAKFSGAAWSPDGQGFYYSRYDEPTEATKLTAANYFQKLFYHRVGDPQSKDRLVYHRPDQKEWGFGASVTDDGRYLLIHVWRGSERKNGVFYQELSGSKTPDDPTRPNESTPSAARPVVELLKDFDSQYEFVGNRGTEFWFHTDFDAPRGRIIAIDVATPDRKAWREVVPQSADTVQSANVVGDRFLVDYLHDARSVVKTFDLTGHPAGEIVLPGIGTAAGFGGRRQDRETFYAFTSYTSPTTIYRYEVESGRSTVFRRPKVDFDPDRYETRQVFYAGKDGTKIPMFITHKKGLALDGRNPTLLYAYGGFNVTVTPQFSVGSLVWMEAGGVYAVPNLRGGGEYGRAWHEAGMKEKKQTVFDDFIAAAEWLIQHRYTSRERLAIQGGSNGGLLVGACLTQRPDVFGVALPSVGVMDMLRYHKFTIGWAWVGEYGSSDDPRQFEYLQKYSPLHNIRPGTKYPATLITTADHDDRVVPAHSFKFAATLQAAQSGEAPVLIRIETKAGHGAGKPTAKRIEETADVLGFTLERMEVELK